MAKRETKPKPNVLKHVFNNATYVAHLYKVARTEDNKNLVYGYVHTT